MAVIKRNSKAIWLCCQALVTRVCVADEAILRKYKFILKIAQSEEIVRHTNDGFFILCDKKNYQKVLNLVEMKPKIKSMCKY